MRGNRLVFAVAVIAALLLALILLETERDRAPERPDAGELRERSEPPDLPAEAIPALEELPPGWRMAEGLVLDAATLLPIEGARVVFSKDEKDSEATTDQSGRWRFPLPGTTDDFFWCRVAAKGYLSATLDLYPQWSAFRVHRAIPPVFLRKATVEIFGLLLGPDGQPMSNADIIGDGAVPIETRTNVAGRFGPIPATAGEFGIEVFAPEGLSWYEVLRIPFKARGRYEVTIRIPAPMMVDGITIDDRGRPLPGVRLFDGGGARRFPVISGPDGRFRWPLTTPASCLTALKTGYLQATDDPVHPGGDIEIVMERTASLSGHIVRFDGSPAPPGLSILCGGEYLKVADDGAFHLGPFRASKIHLAVGFEAMLRAGDRWLITHNPHLETGERREGFVLRLPALTKIEGGVVDAATRRPIAGATVNGAVTDQKGRYTLTDVKENLYLNAIRLNVTAQGYLPLATRYSATDPALLRAAREISVLVVSETDSPAPGTLVRVLGAELSKDDISGVTDLTGRCRVRAPAGEAAVVRCLAHGRDPVEISCGADQSELTMVVGPPFIRCLVLARDEKGMPLPGAFVEDDFGRTPADTAGRIVLARFDGEAFLTAPGRERIPLDLDHNVRDLQLDFKLGQAAPVRLRLLYEDGTPVPAASIESDRGSYLTDANGRVEIEGYAKGATAEITCDVEGWQTAIHEVIAGEQTHTIRLSGRGEIVVRYARPEGNREPPITHLSGPELWENEVPFFERRRPGEVHLSIPECTTGLFFRVPPAAFRFYPDLRVRAGERIELDYDFPLPGRIEGRVLGPDGEALAQARVMLFEFQSADETTDSEGRFLLSLRSNDAEHAVGMLRLLVTHPDCAPVLTEPFDLGRDQDLTIRLTRGGTLAGRVLGIEESVELTLLTPGAAINPVAGKGENGEFEFRGRIAAGRHRIRIETEGGETWLREVEVLDGEDARVTIRLP
jgi:hypothetical protein